MPHRRIADRLQAAVGLSAADRALLGAVPKSIRSYPDRTVIEREADAPAHCFLIFEGFVIRQKVVGGRNQILAFYVPGDAPDLHTLHLPQMDHDLVSVGPTTVTQISHVALKEMLAQSLSLTHAFWRETLIDAAIYREWVANVGSRDALARVAHLICELASRLEIVGLVQDGSFNLPFTQANLADACSLSNVHLNRTLQELRRRRLIKWEGRTVTLLDREQLEQIAEFDPGYLHQEDGQVKA